MKNQNMFQRCLSFVLALSLICPAPLWAQNVVLPQAESAFKVGLSEPYRPALLNGITIHPDNPFVFDFTLSTGDSGLSGDLLKIEAGRLIRYFMTALTVPEKDLWVNLSPYEADKILPHPLALTEMGRDLLEQDYLLKQLSSSLTDPQDPLGAEFWQKVYARVQDRLGTTQIPVNTFNKIWIVPDQARVYQRHNRAFVSACHLKVMLAEDLAASYKNKEDISPDLRRSLEAGHPEVTQTLSAQVVRDVILPAIEREVNEGELFAPLRQMFYSVILASWFKKTLHESLIGQVYADRSKVGGIDFSNEETARKIYQRYVEAFRRGTYNYIKEEYDALAQRPIPRKYFSGGISTGVGENFRDKVEVSSALADQQKAWALVAGGQYRVQVAFGAEGETTTEITDHSMLVSFSDQGPGADENTLKLELFQVIRGERKHHHLEKLDPKIQEQIHQSLLTAGEARAADFLRDVRLMPVVSTGDLQHLDWVSYVDEFGEVSIFIPKTGDLDERLTKNVIRSAVQSAAFYNEDQPATLQEAQDKADAAVQAVEVIQALGDRYEAVRDSYSIFQNAVSQQASSEDLRELYRRDKRTFKEILDYVRRLPPDIVQNLTRPSPELAQTDFKTPERVRAVAWFNVRNQLLETLGLIRSLAWYPGIDDYAWSEEVAAFSRGFFHVPEELWQQSFTAMMQEFIDGIPQRLTQALADGRTIVFVSAHPPPDMDSAYSSFVAALRMHLLGGEGAVYIPVLRGEDYPAFVRFLFEGLGGIKDYGQKIPRFFNEGEGKPKYIRAGDKTYYLEGGGPGDVALAPGAFRLMLADENNVVNSWELDQLIAVEDHHELASYIKENKAFLSVIKQDIGATALIETKMKMGLGMPLPESGAVGLSPVEMKDGMAELSAEDKEAVQAFFVFDEEAESWRPVKQYFERFVKAQQEGSLTDAAQDSLLHLWRQAHEDYPMALLLTMAFATFSDDTRSGAPNKMKVTPQNPMFWQIFKNLTGDEGEMLHWFMQGPRWKDIADHPAQASKDDRKAKGTWKISVTNDKGQTSRLDFAGAEIERGMPGFIDAEGNVINWWWVREVQQEQSAFAKQEDKFLVVTVVAARKDAPATPTAVSHIMLTFNPEYMTTAEQQLARAAAYNAYGNTLIRLGRESLGSRSREDQDLLPPGVAGKLVRQDFLESSLTMAAIPVDGLGLVSPEGVQEERKVAAEILAKLFRNQLWPLARTGQTAGTYYIDAMGVDWPANKESVQQTLVTHFLFVLDGQTHRVETIRRDENGRKVAFTTVDYSGKTHDFRITSVDLVNVSVDGSAQELSRLRFQEVDPGQRAGDRRARKPMVSDEHLRQIFTAFFREPVTSWSDAEIQERAQVMAKRHVKASYRYQSTLNPEEKDALEKGFVQALTYGLTLLRDGRPLDRQALGQINAMLNLRETVDLRGPQDRLLFIGEMTADEFFPGLVDNFLKDAAEVDAQFTLADITALFHRFIQLRPYAEAHRSTSHVLLDLMLLKAGLPVFPLEEENLRDIEFVTPEALAGRMSDAFEAREKKLGLVEPAAETAPEPVKLPGGIVLDTRQMTWAADQPDFEPVLMKQTPADFPGWDVSSFGGFQLHILNVHPQLETSILP